MRHRLFLLVAVLLLCLASSAFSQIAALNEVHGEGLKTLSQPQFIQLTGLTIGSKVGRADLQGAADLLLRSGLFSKVTYSFNTKNEAVSVTYNVEETPRLKVTYDNFPWFADSELSDAIRKDLPFYDGTLPEGGTVVDIAGNSIAAFLAAKGTVASVGHDVIVNPLADGSLQQFHVDGIAPRIASVEFSDPNLKDNKVVLQHLPEIRGKAYSRMAIDIFLAEAIRPVYQELGNLRATLGPPEVRLTGDPNQKLPEQIPVYVPCNPGPAYQWQGMAWSGNTALSTAVLTNTVGMKESEVANGSKIEQGFDQVRDAYGHLGYLEVKLNFIPVYDDPSHKVTYQVAVTEGAQFHFNAMTITGMSLAGEKLIREAWPQNPGDVFDKKIFDDLLTRLQLPAKRETVFKQLPIHYDTVGHWLQTDPVKGTVDVLLDFK
jgi:outer membrane protein assembly factor BamA